MSWEVEYTDEFGDWWNSLSEAEQDSVAAQVLLLEQLGPHTDEDAVDEETVARLREALDRLDRKLASRERR